jgi:hypothetical protein
VSQFGDDAALHNVQSVRIRGATGGSFTLTYDDDTTGAAPNPQTTGAIAWNVSAAALKAALEALSNVTTVNVTGAGTDASPYLVELVDDFASHQLLVPDYSALTGRQEWVFDGSGLVKLSVGEQDGSPTYPNIKLLQFHQDNGFVVTLPAAGTALVSQTAASAATVGYVTTARQRIGGQKDLDLLCVGLGSTVDLSSGGQPTVAVGDSLGNLTRIFGNVIEQFDNTLTHSTVIGLTANGLELSGDGTAIYVGRDYLLGGHGFHVVVVGDSSFNGYPSLNLFNSFAGTMAHGGTATTGGLTFVGGLYTGGSLVAGTITVGATAISGGTVGDLLTIGAGPVVSSASLSSLLDGLGGVTGAF